MRYRQYGKEIFYFYQSRKYIHFHIAVYLHFIFPISFLEIIFSMIIMEQS